jgi:hypothetical protein
MPADGRALFKFSVFRPSERKFHLGVISEIRADFDRAGASAVQSALRPKIIGTIVLGVARRAGAEAALAG